MDTVNALKRRIRNGLNHLLRQTVELAILLILRVLVTVTIAVAVLFTVITVILAAIWIAIPFAFMVGLLYFGLILIAVSEVSKYIQILKWRHLPNINPPNQAEHFFG